MTVDLMENTSCLRAILKAERPIAFDSPDHIVPWGTRHDNSVHRRFNEKLWRVFPIESIVKVLDLGCAGGGFVKSCIEDGHWAVGLEGSDFSKNYRRAAWALIPDLLFTCDISRPFQLFLDADQHPLKFDVVTSWEVIEHIKEEDLANVAENVHRHLAAGGLWILSIANHEEVVGGVRLHQTVQGKSWWRQKLESLGFFPVDEFVHYFSGQFVRGARKESERSFHFVLTNDSSKTPAVPPPQSMSHRLFDAWHGSAPQKYLHKLIVG